jgi:hypothetical protein
VTSRGWRTLDRIAEASVVERPEYRLLMSYRPRKTLTHPDRAGPAGTGPLQQGLADCVQHGRDGSVSSRAGITGHRGGARGRPPRVGRDRRCGRRPPTIAGRHPVHTPGPAHQAWRQNGADTLILSGGSPARCRPQCLRSAIFATRPGAKRPAPLEADLERRRLRTVVPMRRRHTDGVGPERDRPSADQALRTVPQGCFERAAAPAGDRLALAWQSAVAALTLHTRLAGAVQASLPSVAAAASGEKGSAR